MLTGTINYNNPCDNIPNVIWEAYASERCGNAELEGAEHCYSDNMLAKGRVSYFKEAHALTLSFRGTANLTNWFNDICIARKNLNVLDVERIDSIDGEIHEGFAREYIALQQDERFKRMLQSVKEEFQQNSNLKLIITGHSLGGALATLCAADILRNHREAIQTSRVALITFCSPRTGDQAFADCIDKANFYKNIRVEVKHDPVSIVPARNGDSYAHRGELVTLRVTGNGVQREVVIEPNVPEEVITWKSLALEVFPFAFEMIKSVAGPGDLINPIVVCATAISLIIDDMNSSFIPDAIASIKKLFVDCAFTGFVLHEQYQNCKEYQQILKTKRELEGAQNDGPPQKRLKIG